MIPVALITEWSQQCPWVSSAQVEQDLVLSRSLVEIYSDPALCELLVFRGGTALHKIVLEPAVRYSEDLDFVQIEKGPIGGILDRIKEKLNPWLGNPTGGAGPKGTTLTYRFASEQPPVTPLRLKIEINTREHFHLRPLEKAEFPVNSRWFTGTAQIPIYATTELLGTKMRALYQRRKGRDLFDLWHAHTMGRVNPAEVVPTFLRYMAEEDHKITGQAFRENLAQKMSKPAFLSDTPPLLRPGVNYDPHEAYHWVENSLLTLLP